MSKTKIDPLTDWNGFFEELQSESPRAAVIIASAFLDAQLRMLISKSLIDDSKIVDELMESDLATFSARIKVAYCLGLISESLFHDLNIIRKIRNKFAHEMHGYTFDEPEIVAWCNSLKLAKMITDATPRVQETHGTLFILGVTQLASWIGIKILEIEQTHKVAPKNPKLAQVVIVGDSKKDTEHQ